jgi:hypothetical protein
MTTLSWITDINASGFERGFASNYKATAAYSFYPSAPTKVFTVQSTGDLLLGKENNLSGNPATVPSISSNACWVGNIDNTEMVITGGPSSKFNVGIYGVQR